MRDIPKRGGAPAPRAHARAVEEAVRVSGVVPPEGANRAFPRLQYWREMPVYIRLVLPDQVPTVAPRVGLDLDDRRQVCFEGRIPGGPSIEPPLLCPLRERREASQAADWRLSFLRAS